MIFKAQHSSFNSAGFCKAKTRLTRLTACQELETVKFEYVTVHVSLNYKNQQAHRAILVKNKMQKAYR